MPKSNVPLRFARDVGRVTAWLRLKSPNNAFALGSGQGKNAIAKAASKHVATPTTIAKTTALRRTWTWRNSSHWRNPLRGLASHLARGTFGASTDGKLAALDIASGPSSCHSTTKRSSPAGDFRCAPL